MLNIVRPHNVRSEIVELLGEAKPETLDRMELQPRQRCGTDFLDQAGVNGFDQHNLRIVFGGNDFVQYVERRVQGRHGRGRCRSRSGGQ